MWQLLADTLDYSYSTTTTTSSGDAGTLLAIYGVMLVLAIPLYIIPMWKIFNKCGKPGWAAIVPVYNTWVLFEITGFPAWWALLSLVPFVGLFTAVVSIIAIFRLAKIFGKGVGFGLGMLFLGFIFYPILGYGKAMPVGAAPDGGQPPAGPVPGGPTPGGFGPPESPVPPAPGQPSSPQSPEVTSFQPTAAPTQPADLASDDQTRPPQPPTPMVS